MEYRDPQKPQSRVHPPSPVERRVVFLVMGLLAVITVVLILIQSRYDSARWRERPGRQPAKAAVREQAPASTPEAGPSAIAGLDAMAPPERYDAITLSDKINGKAELYLGAGFQHLETRRFALADKPGIWMERYVYRMDGPRSAFAVYSSQRRREATPLDDVAHGAVAANGLFFMHGADYVEIIASDSSDIARAKMKVLADEFIKARGEVPVEIPELALFPQAARVPGTTVLIADSAFGLAEMNWVFTATYENADAQATAFIRQCETTAEAQTLAAAFNAYWLEFGGEALAPPPGLPDAQPVTILDAYEIGLVRDRYLIGVHEATHLEFGIVVLTDLQTMITEATP